MIPEGLSAKRNGKTSQKKRVIFFRVTNYLSPIRILREWLSTITRPGTVTVRDRILHVHGRGSFYCYNSLTKQITEPL